MWTKLLTCTHEAICLVAGFSIALAKWATVSGTGWLRLSGQTVTQTETAIVTLSMSRTCDIGQWTEYWSEYRKDESVEL